MGGAVAVHVACKRTIPSLAGLVVIDVVEGNRKFPLMYGYCTIISLLLL